jgi:hypothetical protein
MKMAKKGEEEIQKKSIDFSHSQFSSENFFLSFSSHFSFALYFASEPYFALLFLWRDFQRFCKSMSSNQMLLSFFLTFHHLNRDFS